MQINSHQPSLKLSIIGPTTPYRGGIVQYNTDLADSLKKLAKIDLFSFKKQYPKFLYPGNTDYQEIKKISKDIYYTLDSNNPLSWQRTIIMIKNQNPDAVLINWWTLFWQPAFWYISKKLQKSGIPVVFICHNLYDHDVTILGQKIPDKVLRITSERLLKVADGYLVHSSIDAQHLTKVIGKFNKPIITRSLPSPTGLPKPTNKKVINKKLELLFIGFIRPYKGVDILIEAYSKLSQVDRDRIHLNIVGETWGNKDQLINQLDQLNISHNLTYVSTQEMVNYVNKSDLVVLPYKSASASAVIPLAYHLNKPVIATKVGGIGDVVIPNQTGWLIEPDSQELCNLLHKITAQDCLKLSRNIQANNNNDWNTMAKSIIQLINRIRT